MRVQFKVTRFDHTPDLDQLAQEKLILPVEKLLEGADAVADLIFSIEFERTTNHHQHGDIWRAEAQLDLPGLSKELYAEATREHLRDAVDIVKDKLVSEIKKYKEHRQ